MKKHFLIFAATMLLNMTGAFAQDCDYSGTTGPLEWCLKDGTLTISGNGEMPDYDYPYFAPWYQYRQYISTVIIQNGVTTIGNDAFAECKNLTSVTIPNSVKTIEEAAFWYCTSLTVINVESGNNNYASENGVLFNKDKTTLICYPAGKTSTSYTIPNSVKTIGKSAFWCCTKPTTITIGNSVTTIGERAFYQCTSLTTITIPNSVTTIGEGAFYSCYGLKSIVANPQTPPTLGYEAFYEVPTNIPVTIPCLTYDKYSIASGWKEFTKWVVDEPATEYSYSAKCYFPYSDANFTNLTKAGTYYTRLENSVGCDSIICLTLTEQIAPRMCMVSVDENNRNVIVWKQLKEDVAYNIYREGAQGGQYDLVGTIEPNGANSWVDLESNAKIRSYRYKVAGVDTHGTESVRSDAHKTMHLTINAGQNNSWNLIWTAYEGTTYSTYNIYRATGDEIDEFSLIGTMPSGNTSFSDFGAPAEGYVYYMVEIVLNEDCSGGKAFSSIKSNVATNKPGGVGIIETDNYPSLRVYPNPTDGQLHIEMSDYQISDIRIFDVMGRQIFIVGQSEIGQSQIVINVAHLPPGMYFLKIGEHTAKFVRE